MDAYPPEAIVKQMGTVLWDVDERLSCEIGRDEDLSEVTISANGIVEAFPAVERLVSAAPEMPGWKVTAFRQPDPMTQAVKVGAVRVAREDVFFQLGRVGNRVTGLAFVRAPAGTSDQAAGRAMFLLLDAALGEYVAATRVEIRGFDVVEKVDPAWVPLRELAALLS